MTAPSFVAYHRIHVGIRPHRQLQTGEIADKRRSIIVKKKKLVGKLIALYAVQLLQRVVETWLDYVRKSAESIPGLGESLNAVFLILQKLNRFKNNCVLYRSLVV